MRFCTTHTGTLAEAGFTKCKRCRRREARRVSRLKLTGMCLGHSDKRALQGKQYCGLCSQKQIRRYRALRTEVLSYYGKGTLHCQCAGCRTVYIGFLQIDHKKGDGYKHTNAKGQRLKGPQLLLWLKRHDYPKGFQVLCANCNHGKRRKFHCPMYGEIH
jgi:hypothetical protein